MDTAWSIVSAIWGIALAIWAVNLLKLRKLKKLRVSANSLVAQIAAFQNQPGAVSPVNNLSALPKESTTEPIIAYRAWCWEGASLTACSVYAVWQLRAAPKAVCLNGNNYSHHSAPQPDCNCGWYAFKTPLDLENSGYGSGSSSYLTGRVALWGRVIECTGGYRAEYAYPQAFFLGIGKDETAKAAARSYGVDCVPAPEEIAAPYKEQIEREELLPLATCAILRAGIIHATNIALLNIYEIRAWAQDELAHRAKQALQFKGWVFPEPHRVAQILESGGKINANVLPATGNQPGSSHQGNLGPAQGIAHSLAGNNAQPRGSGFSAITIPAAVAAAHPGVINSVLAGVQHQTTMAISAGSSFITNGAHYLGGW